MSQACWSCLPGLLYSHCNAFSSFLHASKVLNWRSFFAPGSSGWNLTAHCSEPSFPRLSARSRFYFCLLYFQSCLQINSSQSNFKEVQAPRKQDGRERARLNCFTWLSSLILISADVMGYLSFGGGLRSLRMNYFIIHLEKMSLCIIHSSDSFLEQSLWPVAGCSE